jgi:hypothetical protein
MEEKEGQMNPKKIVAVLALLPVLVLAASYPAHPASADIIQRQLRIVSVQAFKFQGYQPLDVMVQITDEFEAPVSDANVDIALPSGEDIRLKGLGKGTYLGCDVAYFDGPAKGVVVAASANKKGWKGAGATTRANVGNLCGAGEPQMIVQSIQAAKLDGKRQPLTINVRIVDEMGQPVVGAKVLARATDFNTYRDGPLKDLGNGYYGSCAFGFFDTIGEGAISIHVRADLPGFRSGQSDARNSVGTLCNTPLPPPPPNDLNEVFTRALGAH